MSQHAYPHQQLWDSMQSRFVQAILHFDSLVYHDELLDAFESELDVLKAVIGRTRLQTGQMPPESRFMKAIVAVFSMGSDGDWSLLRPAALDFGVLYGGVLPRDVTGFPQWWERYPSTCLTMSGEEGEPFIPDSINDWYSVPAWNLVKHINLAGGADIGMQQNAKPEGQLAEFQVKVWRLHRAIQPLQAQASQDWTDLAELFNMEASTHLARAVALHDLHEDSKDAMAQAKSQGENVEAPGASASRGGPPGKADSSAGRMGEPDPARFSGSGASAEDPVEIDLDEDMTEAGNAEAGGPPPAEARRRRGRSGRSVSSVDFS